MSASMFEAIQIILCQIVDCNFSYTKIIIIKIQEYKSTTSYCRSTYFRINT